MKAKLKAIWYTAIWAKDWMKFCFHYLRVWEPGARGAMTREQIREMYERMKEGPLGLEYRRIEGLKHRAVNAWAGE